MLGCKGLIFRFFELPFTYIGKYNYRRGGLYEHLQNGKNRVNAQFLYGCQTQ